MKIGILPCQGACNVGVMTNKVALQFVNNESVNMVCPLGLPLGIEHIIKMGAANDRHVALNGCPDRCASKALESAGFTVSEEVVLTQDFGIKKNKKFDEEPNMGQVVSKVAQVLATLSMSETNQGRA